VVADLAAIQSAGRETTTIVAFTNTAEIKAVNLTQTGKLSAKTAVAKVEL
jgi:PTS system glucose-specific IIC component